MVLQWKTRFLQQILRDDFLVLLLSIFYYNALCAFFEASLQRTGCGTLILWLFVYPMLDFYNALQAVEIQAYIQYFYHSVGFNIKRPDNFI